MYLSQHFTLRIRSNHQKKIYSIETSENDSNRIMNPNNVFVRMKLSVVTERIVQVKSEGR